MGVAWADAEAAAALLAADRPGIRAIRLRGGLPEVVAAWLNRYRALAAGSVHTAPSHVDGDALVGGLDIEATLVAGRPTRERGLLDRARGGTLVVRGADALSRDVAAILANAVDAGTPRLVLLDGGDGEEMPTIFARAAITLDLRTVRWCEVADADPSAGARAPFGVGPAPDDDAMLALDRVALALPGSAVRRLSHLSALASALAAGGDAVRPEHLVGAVRLNTGIPLPFPDAEPPLDDPGDASPPQEAPTDAVATGASADDWSADDPSERDGHIANPPPSAPAADPDRVVEAPLAALPPGLLDGVGGSAGGEGRRSRRGVEAARGAPAGIARRAPRPGARPAILPTLAAAVPWQRARDRRAGEPIRIRPSDLRWRRRRRPAGTTIVFAVDASGSAAAERLAEAKGAVEALLAEAYVRRDRVALIAFRAGRAGILLPPTRGLVTAKRSLRDLPGGGATPLAAGLVAAEELCRTARSAGERALMVVLTDGRGNVALDGTTGRLASRDDERRAARAVRAAGTEALVIDTAARPGRHAPALAAEMGATLLAMPRSKGEDWAAAVGGRLGP